jgi:hypothetical protein
MALTDNIIACYSPSVRGSGLLLPDLTGRGNHGTLTNFDQATAWEPAAIRGVSGRTNRHDGSNDYVTGSARAIIGLGDMSWCAWVLVRSGYGVLAHSNWTAGMLWYVGNAGAGVVNQGIYFANNATAAVGSTSLTYNVWNHVGWCRRGTSLDIYLNGRLDVTRTSNTGPTFANTLDWGGYAGSSEWLPGSIGERAVFNRALTAAEFYEIFRRGNGAIGRELTGQSWRRSYALKVPAAVVKSYLFANRGQVIGGGTL